MNKSKLFFNSFFHIVSKRFETKIKKLTQFNFLKLRIYPYSLYIKSDLLYGEINKLRILFNKGPKIKDSF